MLVPRWRKPKKDDTAKLSSVSPLPFSPTNVLSLKRCLHNYFVEVFDPRLVQYQNISPCIAIIFAIAVAIAIPKLQRLVFLFSFIKKPLKYSEDRAREQIKHCFPSNNETKDWFLPLDVPVVTLYFFKCFLCHNRSFKEQCTKTKKKIKSQSQLDGDMNIIHLVQSQINSTLLISRMTNATAISWCGLMSGNQ